MVGDIVQKCLNLNQYDPKIQRIAKDLEANFTSEMLKPIFDNMIEGNEGKIYQSMLVDEYSKVIAPKIGLSEKLACSILNMKYD